MRLVLVAAMVVLLNAASIAKDADARLPTMTKAFVTAADSLSDDQPVAACVLERLERETPLKKSEKDGAEVILTVHGSSIGKHPTAKMTVTLLDGTLLWEGGSKTRGLNLLERDVRCLMAGDLLSNLRDAMRKARDQKEVGAKK